MLTFNQPKAKSKAELEALVASAMADADTDMIGDLTAKDAQTVYDMLVMRGFEPKVETETDARGALVDSSDWKKVTFAKRATIA